MKKSTILVLIIAFCVGFFGFIGIKKLLIKNTNPESCVVKTVTITAINKGTSQDIIFTDKQGNQFYINRGLESGLILDSLNAKVLNKRVTLHLPKLWLGTSEHIAQLTINGDVIFSEFTSKTGNSDN